MNDEKWAEFDRRLEQRLSKLPQAVEITVEEMGAHYERTIQCIADTIKDTVSPKKPIIYNGRKVSAETKRLYDLRVRDFASGRNITKSDRDAWNQTLNKAALRDYHTWVESWTQRMEKADEQGDMRTVYQGANALAGKSKNFSSKQPTRKDKGKGDVIQSEEELGDLWQQFLSGKFSATELEEARQAYEPIGEASDDPDSLTYEEFQKAVKRMKNNKATGPDGIPTEVWKNSALANQELFFFLKNIWEKECVPKQLVLCAFVMIHKKDSSEDCANYRAIGLLNHS